MNVAFVGLGNIGTVFAAHLGVAGKHRVFACVRRAPGRLIVDGKFGRVEGEIESFQRPEEVPSADWIFLATKTHQTGSTSPWFERLLKEKSQVVVLQNGVDAETRVRLLAAHVIPTVVYTNAKRLGPWHVRHMRPEYDLAVPPSDAAKELIELFRDTAIRIEEEPEFLTAEWRKFLVNLIANPLTALVGHGIGALRSMQMERLSRQLLEEAAAVGRAEGAKLPADIADEVLGWMKGFPADTGTSMLEDRVAGRELETDAMTGTALRLGAKHGIPMPMNEAVMALLSAI